MKTSQMASTALCTAATVVLSQLAVPLPGAGAPLSLSLGAVFLCGAVLPWRSAVLSQALYLLLGAAGLPVFANFSGGLGRLAGPTGGFLVAYPVMAFLLAWIPQKLGRKTPRTLAAAAVPALLACYALGAAWYAAAAGVGPGAAVLAVVLPFLPADAAKAAVFLSAGLAVDKALQKARLRAG